MRLLFPILACVAGSLLIGGFVAGMVAPPAAHARLGMVAAAAALAVHGTGLAYLATSAGRVEATARSSGMPGWVGAQAEKNRRKAGVLGAWGVASIVGVAWSGMVGPGRGWHLALSASALTIQLGAFVGEFLMVVAQARLLLDVGAWAGRASAGPLARDP